MTATVISKIVNIVHKVLRLINANKVFELVPQIGVSYARQKGRHRR